MRIDSHQHFWIYEPKRYPWISDELKLIRRNFLPGDLAAELGPLNMDGSIAVQARQTVDESRWLPDLADAHPAILGVVGWVDLQSESVDATLAALARHPKFVGVRHMVQDEPDNRFMLREAFMRGIGILGQYGLTYDLLVFPKQLSGAIELVKEFPGQSFILDHSAKPSIKMGMLSPWREHIKELAQHENVSCKVSGLVTEAKWGEWQQEDFRPYLDIVFEAFGEDRLMFGSDWPVCLLSGSYRDVYGILDQYIRGLSGELNTNLFGGNAARIYLGLPGPGEKSRATGVFRTDPLPSHPPVRQ